MISHFKIGTFPTQIPYVLKKFLLLGQCSVSTNIIIFIGFNMAFVDHASTRQLHSFVTMGCCSPKTFLLCEEIIDDTFGVQLQLTFKVFVYFMKFMRFWKVFGDNVQKLLLSLQTLITN